MDPEVLGKLKQLALQLKKQAGGDSSSDSSDDEESTKKKDPIAEKMPKTLHLLYAASKLRIYKLADKIAANEVTSTIPLHDERIIATPVADSWDFQLGDWVRIKYSMSDFKTIQTRTLGWNARLRTIHGCDGIVTARWSKYENSVTIYTPLRLSTSNVYAGLLEKIPENEKKEDKSFATQWKVDEYVTTIMDERVIQLMQRRLDTIPQRYLGRRGRIIAVTRVAIVVTFNERTSFDINSYLLIRHFDQSSPIEVGKREHTFQVGDKVRVLSSVKQLIKNQKNNGNWNEDMTRFVGKVVQIIHICKDKKLRVQYKLGRHWVINPESVYSLTEPIKDTPQAETEFTAGDIVKVKLTNNMRFLLQKKNVPMIFLDYLRNTAKVKLIDGDCDYLIKFNCDQNVAAYAPTIRKATREEREQHKRIENDVKEIKIGSKVFLDIGPPSFVKTVLSESNAPPDVVHAMTHPSTLIGFADDNRAVIEYECGKRYKIKKKFLTVPDKFNMQGNIDGMGFETAREIQETLANCVQMSREDDDAEGKDNPVRILSMSFDTTPMVDLRVYSVNVSVDRISELLITVYGWDVQITAAEEAIIRVHGLETFDREIKISLFFNQEPYIAKSPVMVVEKDIGLSRPVSNAMKLGEHEVEENTETISSTPVAKAAAEPIYESTTSRGPRVEYPVTRPQSVHDFEYMPLPGYEDMPVLFPFYVPQNRGQRRAFAADNDRRSNIHQISTSSGSTNNFKFENVNSVNLINNP